jgi:hypothetical protein
VTDADNPLELASDRLGPPDATHRVSPGRFAAKVAVGLGLVLYGVVANYLWWVPGPARFDHLALALLFAPPLSGVSLLWHVLRTRGLHVLVYPNGLLRVHAGEVESYPWADVDEVRVRADAAEVRTETDDAGAVTACWLAVEPPHFQIWKAGVTVRRADGAAVTLTPALEDYAGLAERIQRATFAELWPAAWAKYRAGGTVRFGDFAASWGGLAFRTQPPLPWAEFKTVAVSQKVLSVTRTAGWVPWAVLDLQEVPNPHVMLALVAEARRQAGAGAADEDDG